MANWKELPQDVPQLIARRLAIEDFIALRGLCTSWRSAVAKETYNVKSKALWLMIHTYSQIAEFSIPLTERIYPVRLPGSHDQTLSTPGCILVSRGVREYHIFNPLSGVSSELPTSEKLHHQLHLIHMMVLSSSPSLSRSYTVMISYGISPGFAILRSGEDAWTVANRATLLRWCAALQLIYYDGLFVALDEQSQMMTLNGKESRMELRLVLGLNFYFDGDPLLLECSGSLLVAWAIRGEKYNGPVNEPVKEIRVFKVDLEKGTEEEVKSLVTCLSS